MSFLKINLGLDLIAIDCKSIISEINAWKKSSRVEHKVTQNEEIFFCERLISFAWKNYLEQLAVGNCLGAIIWSVIIHGTII